MNSLRTESERERLNNALYDADKMDFLVKKLDYGNTIEDEIKKILHSPNFHPRLLDAYMHTYKNVETKNGISYRFGDIYIKDKGYEKMIQKEKRLQKEKRGFMKMDEFFDMDAIYNIVSKKNCKDFFEYQISTTFQLIKSDIEIENVNKLYVFLEEELKAHIETVWLFVENGVKRANKDIELATTSTNKEVCMYINGNKILSILPSTEAEAKVAYHILSMLHSQQKIDDEISENISDEEIKQLNDYFTLDADF